MGRKHWEKEKLLVTSNFSFSHSVFKRLVPQTRKNQGLFGKGLINNFLQYINSYHTNQTVNNPEGEAFEKIVGEGENACNLHFPTMFTTRSRKNTAFWVNFIVVLKCFQFGPVWNVVVGWLS